MWSLALWGSVFTHRMMAKEMEIKKMSVSKKTLSEHAVSPVVGVMLMLVVTIIIAAVVSAFAGGMATGKEKAPQASLETHISLAGYSPELSIKHMGGDPINTKDVKIVTTWANDTGIYHVGSTVAPTYNVSETTPYHGSLIANYSISTLNTNYYGSIYNEPYRVIPGDNPADGSGEETSLWFGNYVMHAGDVIKTQGNLDPANTVTDMKVIKDVELLTGNEIVNVKLIDLKTGTTIYDKNVNVEV